MHTFGVGSETFREHFQSPGHFYALLLCVQLSPSRTYWNQARSATNRKYRLAHFSSQFSFISNINQPKCGPASRVHKPLESAHQPKKCVLKCTVCSVLGATRLYSTDYQYSLPESIRDRRTALQRTRKEIQDMQGRSWSEASLREEASLWSFLMHGGTWGCVLVETICSTVVLQQCNRGLSLHLPGPPATSSELKYSRFLGTRWLKMTKQFRGKTITADGCVEFRKRTLDEWAWTFMADNRQPVT